MPKTKRNRKNRKKHHRRRQPSEVEPINQPTTSNNNFVEDTPLRGISNFVEDTPLKALSNLSTSKSQNKLCKLIDETPLSRKENEVLPDYLDLTTPVRPRRTSLQFRNEPNEIEATPVNKRRSLNRQNDQSGLWNATNLNVLFDSQPVSKSSETCLNYNRTEGRPRSSSSIPKLHSPGKEKPLLVNTATQTVENESEKYNNDVLDTPQRLNKNDSNIIRTSADVHELHNNLENMDAPLNNKKNVSKLTKFTANEVNINPYLKQRELNTWTKQQNSVESFESFFCPQMFEVKSSSTPIQKHLQENKLLNVLKESIRENFDHSVSMSNLEHILNNKILESPKRDVSRTPISEKVSNRNLEQINVNTPRFEKVVAKEPSIIMSSSRKAVKKSPKIKKVLNHSRVSNQSVSNKSVSYCRFHASRRSTLDPSHSLLATTSPLRLGIYDRMITRIKRYGRASTKWSIRMMEACAQMGIQIKNSLTSVLCSAYAENSMLECTVKAQSVTCKCDEYEEEIRKLNVKIEDLQSELLAVKRQIEECKNDEGKSLGMEDLKEQLEKCVLEKVKQELNQFLDLRTELAALKDQFKCLQAATPRPATAPPPPPAPPLPSPCGPSLPPPPPPPPPPPLTMTMATPSSRPQLGKRSRTIGDQKKQEEDRPVISLDDILKVKLKKSSDRATSFGSKMNLKPQGTAVSMEMLQQVKLRPASRTSLLRQELSTPSTDTDRSSGSTSPHSSLCRLLSVDNGVWRVKRLRKVGGYSLDSVNRPTARTAANGTSPNQRLGTSPNRLRLGPRTSVNGTPLRAGGGTSPGRRWGKELLRERYVDS